MGPGAPAHAVGPTPEIGEQFHGASLYGADLFHEDDMYSQIEEETSGWNLLYPHNLPEITSGRLPEINIKYPPTFCFVIMVYVNLIVLVMFVRVSLLY